jgi:hypothetical protein
MGVTELTYITGLDPKKIPLDSFATIPVGVVLLNGDEHVLPLGKKIGRTL